MRSSSRSHAHRRVQRPSQFLVALLLGLLAAAPSPAGAVVSSTPDLTIEANSDITSVVQSANRVFIAGNFTRAGRATGGGADLSQSTGTPDFSSARPNSNVTVVIADGAGGWYVGGAFTRIGGVARNRLAHILAGGAVDPAFDPNINLTVNVLALSGTTLYAGGQFTTVNGSTTRNRIAAFDTATGIATSFNPSVNSAQVQSMTISGGILYAGGGFTSVGSPAVTRNRLASWDLSTGALTSFDPNMGQNVSALAVSGSTVYAGGGFTAVNGSPGVTRNRIAAFDATTGTVVAGFDPNMNNSVAALSLAGGVLYAGGTFTTVNGGTARAGIAAFDPSTGVATSFNPTLSPAAATSISVSGGTIFVGGPFSSVNGGVPRNNIAAFNADGSVVAGFDPNIDGTVTTVATAGSRVYAGGPFSFVGAGTLRNRIAAMLPDGSLDPTFNPNVGSVVRALAVSGSTLYAGGDFTTVNGATTRNHLAAFDTTTGVADPAFDPNLDGTVNSVNALALSGGRLYAGGNFTTVNGATTRNRLAAFDPATGIADATFNPNVSGGSVNAITVSAGTVYAGGTFSTVNGSTTRNRLAAFDASTGASTAFNPNVGSSTVSSLLLSGSLLYAGGNFSTVNATTTRNDLAAFATATGIADPAFNPNVNSNVYALALSGSTLYAGGTFTTVNGATARSRLAALDAATGVADATVNPGASSDVNALVASGSRLYVGGSFITMGLNPQSRFAQFTQPAVAPTVTTGAASAVATTSATLTATVNPNAAATTYVFEYGPSTAFGSISAPDDVAGAGPVAVTANLTGLAPDTTYYYRAVATNAAGSTFGAVLTFRTTGGSPAAPVAITLPAGATTTTTADLAGQVNPNGQQTAYTFEYGTTTAFGSITPVVALDDARALEPVSATLTGLAPDTTYYFRVVASNATGTTPGAVRRFNTGPGGAPIATTGAASAVGPSAATLAATVDAHGAQTTFAFEYGTSNAFGSLSAIDNAGDANGAQAVTLPVGGLQPGTTYRYRVVATNAFGTTTGAVMSFTTAPAAA